MTIADRLAIIAENQQKVYDAGKAAGGYDDGVAAGKQSEYDTFWDTYQQNGNRTNYYQRFLQDGWRDENFRPKYPIICKDDSSAASSVFSRNRATTIPVPIYVEGVKMQETFYYAQYLKTITLLSLKNVPEFKSTFSGCTRLENITIDGSIDVSISFSVSSKLTNASVQSIIDHLKDLTGATTQTLTFHTDVKITTAQKQKATDEKNWTIVGGTEVANDYFDS